MALSGKLLADFSSFYDAVTKAETKLVDFQSGSAKVEASLTRMTDTFSGRKIIQEATLMAEALERSGGTSKLTAAELERVGMKAADAADKMRRLGIEVPPHLQKLADTVKPTTGFFSDLSGEIVKVGAGFLSAQAVISGVTGAYHQLSQFVGDSVHAFADAEAADVKLVAALRQHSLATPQVIAQYHELGATFQRTTKFSDDEIASMQALLTQVGGVLPSAMAGALKASTDLASGLGIDLQSATTLVAKAAAGHTENLGKYGIAVSQAAVESRGFDAVLEAVNRQFGGQAAAEIETYAGRIKQIGNSWNNMQEAVGEFILQNPAAVAAVRALQDATAKGDKATGEATMSWVQFARFIGADFLAGPIAALEAHAMAMNDEAKFAKQLADVKSPFAAIVADAGALPPITAGMKLFNDQLVDEAKALKASEQAGEQFAAGMRALSAVGIGWQGTLDTINGAVVEGIKYYLEAGVAQSALADVYGLTAAQVKSVASALADENEATKTAAELNKAAAHAAAQWADVMGDLNTVGVGWQGTLDTIDGSVVEAIKYYLAAGVAQSTLATAYGLTAAQVKAVASALATGQDAHAMEAKSVQDLTGLVHTLAGEYIAVAEGKARAAQGGSFEITRENFEASARGVGANEGLVENLLKKGYSFQQALLYSKHPDWPPPPNPGPRVPGFAGGVENFGGGLAMVGERGPEVVNLPRGSDVIPFGRSGATTVHVEIKEIKVSGVLDPRTIRELSESVSTEIVKTLKAVRQFGSA